MTYGLLIRRKNGKVTGTEMRAANETYDLLTWACEEYGLPADLDFPGNSWPCRPLGDMADEWELMAPFVDELAKVTDQWPAGSAGYLLVIHKKGPVLMILVRKCDWI